MLKKVFRGLKQAQIKEVLNEGEIIQAPLFGVKILEKTEYRCAMVVSKKISKRAVDRNRIRRRLSEGMSKNMKNETNCNYWIVWLIKKSMLTAKMEEIEEQLKYVYKKICTENIGFL